MTPKIINLVTPKADKKPRAQSSALPSLAAAAATSLFDLTADTPSPISARGIADDDNDCRGGNAHHDVDRQPDLPRLPGMRKYARSNTLSSLKLVTHSSPWRKKARSLEPRLGGKENFDFSICNESPMVVDHAGPIQAGKNPLSASRLDTAKESSEVVIAISEGKVCCPEDLIMTNGFKLSVFYTDKPCLVPNCKDPACAFGHTCKCNVHIKGVAVLQGECFSVFKKSDFRTLSCLYRGV